MDRAAGPDGRERVRQEPQSGMGEVQDDPVDRADLPEHRSGVSLADVHALRPVRRDVRPEQLHCDRIRIGSVDLPGPSSSCDQDRVRPDAGEGIRDDLPFVHEVRDPPPLGGEPRAEIRRREVDPIPQPVLHMDRRRPSLSGDEPNLAHAAFSLDSVVLGRDPDLRVPAEDGAPDRFPMGPQALRDLDDRDVTDDIERTRQRWTERGRHVGHVLVGPDRHEFLGEVALVDREADRHATRRRQQQEVALPHDAKMLQEEAALEELLSDPLALRLWDGDAPGPHVAAMPPPAVKRFRASRKRS